MMVPGLRAEDAGIEADKKCWAGWLAVSKCVCLGLDSYGVGGIRESISSSSSSFVNIRLVSAQRSVCSMFLKVNRILSGDCDNEFDVKYS